MAADRMNKRSLSGGSVLAPIPPMHGEAPMEDPHDRQRFMHMEASAQAHPGYEGLPFSPCPNLPPSICIISSSQSTCFQARAKKIRSGLL